MAVKISEDLLEPIGLAQDVYSCWRELMITDKVKGAETWPTWLTLNADWRNAFVEAIRMTVTDPLGRTADALDRESAIDDAFGAFTKPESRECYICQKDFVTATGRGPAVCGSCRRMYDV